MLNLPIVEMLLQYRRTSPLSFHVPGHRNGSLLEAITDQLTSDKHDSESKKYLQAFKTLMEIDLTELSITDDLHDPQYAIKEAQQRAASLYKVNHTFFLVGGSTVGNIASILAACEPQDYIIVQRNAHKSVINGCKLAGVNVIFVSSEIDEQSGYSTIPAIELLQEAIEKYPQAKAVFLTSPNYYGISKNLSEYVNLIHASNMLLIVDEAHGAHYGLHTSLPKSAISYGADLVIQSTHKTLPSITMSAMLHVNTRRISVENIQEQLATIESSSPSFLLLASLDIATALIESNGKVLIEQSLHTSKNLIEALNSMQTRLAIEQYEHKSDNFSYDYDPLRMHVYDKLDYYSGYELLELFSKHGVWAEMATSKHCIFVVHLGYTMKEYEALLERLIDISAALVKGSDDQAIREPVKRVSSYYNSQHIGEPILMKRNMYYETTLISIEEAIGFISAEQLVPYPPGIPVLFSGEKITASIVDEIKHYINNGIKFQANDTVYNGKIKIIVN